jgi:hypothetical protein
MGGVFSSPKIPGPSAAQLQAQETQARLAAAEEARQKTAQDAEEAARRARAARAGGRSLLLTDDVGITENERAPQRTLGG